MARQMDIEATAGSYAGERPFGRAAKRRRSAPEERWENEEQAGVAWDACSMLSRHRRTFGCTPAHRRRQSVTRLRDYLKAPTEHATGLTWLVTASIA
jgi:hypothetical protein